MKLNSSDEIAGAVWCHLGKYQNDYSKDILHNLLDNEGDINWGQDDNYLTALSRLEQRWLGEDFLIQETHQSRCLFK